MRAISLLLFLSIMAWGISVTGGIWFLLTLREIRDELRTLRRLLQDAQAQRRSG